MREYLKKAMKYWLSQGGNIILYIDANKIVRKDPLGKLIRNLGIR